MTVIETRTLTAEDEPLVLSLDKEFELSSPLTETDDPDLTFEKFYRVLPELRGVALAATIDGEAVGYGLIAPRITASGPDQASGVRVLTHIAVLPEHQKKGVGSVLLTRLTSKAKRAGLSMLTAHIPEHLIPFYESHGWTVLSENETVAWIEQPSVKLWEAAATAARKDGVSPSKIGPRTKMSMLRHEGKDEDPRYPRIAYIILRPQEIVHLFPVPESPAPSHLRPHILLANISRKNPALYKTFPKDVQQNAFIAISEEVKTNPNISPELVKTWLPK